MKPSGPGAASVVLAHAFALSAVSHCHYVFHPPTRQLWVVIEVALAALLWPAVWWATRRVWAIAREAPATRLGLPLVLGLFVNIWYAGLLADTLWLHGPLTQAILTPVLAIADWLVVSAIYAALLAITIAVMTPTPDLLFPPPLGGRVRVGGERPESGSTLTHREPPNTPHPGPPPQRVRGKVSWYPSAWFVLATFAFFLIAANAFAVWYVRQERTLYFWDYMVYWDRCADLAEMSPRDAYDDVRRGTQRDDYGPLPAVPPVVVMAAFNDSRLVYVLAVVNLYLPAFALTAWLFVRRFASMAEGVAVVVPLLLVLLSPVVWVPIVRGYLDIGGAALAVLALLVYLSRPAGALPWSRILLLAALLAGMAVFRRWYSFFVVAFFLVAGVDSLIASIRGGWRRLMPIVLTGFWSLVFLVSVAGGWVYRVATTNYAADYSAYKNPYPLTDRLWRVIDNCGPGTVAAMLLGALVLLAYRDTRRAALVLVVMPPIMVLHFLRLQDFAPHHCYLFLPAFVLLPGLALVRVLSSVPAWVRWPAVVPVAAAGVAAMAVMFVPAALPYYDSLRPAVARLHFPPLVRDDLPEFVRLLKATETEAAKTDPGKVAVVASSLIISQTMFVTADQSLREPLFHRDRITITTEVDRVTGFPVEYFRAAILVVPTPPQLHLRPEEQQVIVRTVESLQANTDIGHAFDRLPGEFHLSDGVTIHLYRRARPIAPADFEAYCRKLQQAHPDAPTVFTPPEPVAELLRVP